MSHAVILILHRWHFKSVLYVRINSALWHPSLCCIYEADIVIMTCCVCVNSELWNGVRCGPTAAVEHFGVDEVSDYCYTNTHSLPY